MIVYVIYRCDTARSIEINARQKKTQWGTYMMCNELCSTTIVGFASNNHIRQIKQQMCHIHLNQLINDWAAELCKKSNVIISS